MIGITGFGLVFLFACGGSDTGDLPVATPDEAVFADEVELAEPDEATEEVEPTATPKPTATPTQTPTPIPAGISLSAADSQLGTTDDPIFLEEDEIVAVLAHEVGHYKKKHIIFNLFSSILLAGFTFYILSLFISNPMLSRALGVEIPSFHIGLIAFGLLYAPISEITGLIMNLFSRKFEYQADDYAKNTFKSEPLITSLKKLSKNSLSNLTPHPAYVFMHYSHPTLLERIKNLKK